MGTLYECLKEARLEKYYGAFRANGITRSESLANLTMPEFCAMGISGAEDRRRLVELVNIIKSVHRGQLGGCRKRQQGSPNSNPPTSSRQAGAASSNHASSQSDKKVPRRHTQSPTDAALGGNGGGVGNPHPYSSGMRLEPTRDVSVRERGPNFSAASYLDMLEFMSDSSGHSDAGDQPDLSPDSDDNGLQAGSRDRGAATPPVPTFSTKAPKKISALDRVRAQSAGTVSSTRSKGYNYGVPGSRESSSSSSSKPRMRASGRGVTKDDRIRVCVRKRPVSRRESRAADADIVEATSTSSVEVKEPKVAVDLTAFTMKHEFVFDEVFDEDCTNEDVYIRAARPLIGTVFQGGNATFFAYGQTGAGKTHTMLGGNGTPGLYQLAAKDVYDIMASGRYGSDLHVWVSFFEIYCGQLFDLLNRRNRVIPREDGSHRVCIAGLTETEAADVDTLIKVLQYGNSVRSRGTSGVNPDSSRSHAVLQLEIRHADDSKLGKISFIDLAGSERASDMGDPDRQTRMEGAEINQSLLALKECIRSIDQENRHTPFRQSKLTHILKDAFVGNSRTCMIANVSPCHSSCEHTLNTLRYADRVKELRRESSPSGRSGGGGGGVVGGSASTLGQAMNLLMNIPLTAPSIFHPSNVLSTSTPVRPRPASSRQLFEGGNSAAAADIILDPSETPIRGHHMVPKSSSAPKLLSTKSGPAGGGRPVVRGSVTSKRRETAVAAAQGVYQPHPEASPSESDLTDTDSNNVTHPTETRPAPTLANIPVIGSTDTEFDFPTSDFNNIDDQLNDLNQAQSQIDQIRGTKKPGSEARGQGVKGETAVVSSEASAASSGGARPKSHSSHPKERERTASPKVNQLSRKTSFRQSPAPDRNTPSPSHKQSKNAQNRAEKLSSVPPVTASSASSITAPSIVTSVLKRDPQQVRMTVSELPHHSGAGKETAPVKQSSLAPAADSFDDELLFAGGDSEASKQSQQVQRQNSSSSGDGTVRPNKHLMNVLPAMQTAVSSDLTSFAQRSPLRNGTEKTNTTPIIPRDQRVSPSQPDSHHEAKFGGGEETTSYPRKGSKESIGKARLASPSAAAVKDWVTQTGDGEHATYGKRLAERGNSVATNAQAALPFSAYRGDGDGIQAHSSGKKDLFTKPSSLLSSRGYPFPEDPDMPLSVARSDVPGHRVSSGPSSDPSSHATVTDTREARLRQSSSLPPALFSDCAGLRQNDQEVLSARSAASDSVVISVSSAAIARAMSPSTSAKTSTAPVSTAVVTEKLLAGAVFSPIHPQPVSTTGSRPAPSEGFISQGSNSNIVHPTPVAAMPSDSTTTAAPVVTAYAPSTAEKNQARMSLVSSHEDQLATITSLCKLEMKLLLNAKKSAPRSFDDYMNRVNSILAQKMQAIQQLQDQIRDYRAQFPQHSVQQGASGSYSVSSTIFDSQSHPQ